MSLISSLLYAGLDKDRLNALLPEARAENAHYLEIYSGMTALIFAVCLSVSFLAEGQLVVNRAIYITMIVVGFALYIVTKTLLPRHPALSTPFAIAFILALYGYAFGVSLMHPDMQGVAPVAFMVVMPSLFNYRPISMIGLTIVALVTYGVLVAQAKEQSIAMLEVWNSLFFGGIAMLLSVFQMRVRFRLLQQKRDNLYLSETDLLTGTRNRNSFEENRASYAERCRENVHCIYIDANGLHELNDAKGHETGDRMLKTVAKAIMRRFGQENTYRIGGDEFVAFRMDASEDAVNDDIFAIAASVAGAGYSVSTGSACHTKQEADMRQLIKQAETRMYKEKRRYYEQGAHDRRRRSAQR